MENVDLPIYELAYSAMALATSIVEALPPSPQPARRGGASPCRSDDRDMVAGAHFAFGDHGPSGIGVRSEGAFQTRRQVRFIKPVAD